MDVFQIAGTTLRNTLQAQNLDIESSDDWQNVFNTETPNIEVATTDHEFDAEAGADFTIDDKDLEVAEPQPFAKEEVEQSQPTKQNVDEENVKNSSSINLALVSGLSSATTIVEHMTRSSDIGSIPKAQIALNPRTFQIETKQNPSVRPVQPPPSETSQHKSSKLKLVSADLPQHVETDVKANPAVSQATDIPEKSAHVTKELANRYSVPALETSSIPPQKVGNPAENAMSTGATTGVVQAEAFVTHDHRPSLDTRSAWVAATLNVAEPIQLLAQSTNPTPAIADIGKTDLIAVTQSSLSPAPTTVSHSQLSLIPQTTPVSRDHPVVMQISKAIEAADTGTIELRLDPAELGKIRITMVSRDGVLMATVAAERPETLEFLRRNTDALDSSLGENGFADTDLSFENFSRDEKSRTEHFDSFAISNSEQDLEPHVPNNRLSPSDGLDIRL